MMEVSIAVEQKNSEYKSQREISARVSKKRFLAGKNEIPVKFKANAELSFPDVEVFYSSGIKGYTDYPFLEKIKGTVGDKKF